MTLLTHLRAHNTYNTINTLHHQILWASKDFALNEMPQYNLQKQLFDDQSYHLTLQHHKLINFQHQPVCISKTTIIVNQSLNHHIHIHLIYHATLQSVRARNSVWHGSYMAPCDIATRFHRCSNVERACPEEQAKPWIWTKEYRGKVEDADEAMGIMLMSLYTNWCPKMNWYALDGNAWHEEGHREFGISLYEEVSECYLWLW